MAEISLWLDSYDDIYSDFDSRNYQKRRISEDFVDELKASVKYQTERPDALVLLIPHPLRNVELEQSIIKSFKSQMNARENVLSEKAKKVRNRSLLMIVAGVIVMAAQTVISYKAPEGLFKSLMRILLEPGGWFLIWSGLDFLLYENRSVQREHAFYQHAGSLNVSFRDDVQAPQG